MAQGHIEIDEWTPCSFTDGNAAAAPPAATTIRTTKLSNKIRRRKSVTV